MCITSFIFTLLKIHRNRGEKKGKSEENVRRRHSNYDDDTDEEDDDAAVTCSLSFSFFF